MKERAKESLEIWKDIKKSYEEDLSFFKKSIALHRGNIEMAKLYKEGVTNVVKEINLCQSKIKRYKNTLKNSSR